MLRKYHLVGLTLASVVTLITISGCAELLQDMEEGAAMLPDPNTITEIGTVVSTVNPAIGLAIIGIGGIIAALKMFGKKENDNGRTDGTTGPGSDGTGTSGGTGDPVVEEPPTG